METNEEVGYVTEPVEPTTEDKFGKEALLKYFEEWHNGQYRINEFQRPTSILYQEMM